MSRMRKNIDDVTSSFEPLRCSGDGGSIENSRSGDKYFGCRSKHRLGLSSIGRCAAARGIRLAALGAVSQTEAALGGFEIP